MTLRKQLLIFISALLYVPLLFSQATTQQATTIGGPDALIYLGQRFAERYQAKHPSTQFDVRGSASLASNISELEIVQSEGNHACQAYRISHRHP
jgi:hypothetical protein